MLQEFKGKIDGWERSWKVYQPNTINLKKKNPLLIALHGAGGPNLHREKCWQEKAEKEKFLLIYPEAVMPQLWNGWNKEKVYSPDDVNYLDHLIDWAIEKYPVDLRHIYMIGYSMGDMMASTYVFLHGNRLAATALLVGPSLPSILSDEDGNVKWKPHYSLPVMRVKGDEDMLAGFPSTHNVPNKYYERVLTFEEKLRLGRMNNQIMKDLWFEKNHSEKVPRIIVEGNYNYEWYVGENDFCYLTVKGGGHNLVAETCDEVWKFLQRYEGYEGDRPVNYAEIVKGENRSELAKKTLSKDLQYTLDILDGIIEKETWNLDFEYQCLMKVVREQERLRWKWKA